MPFNFMKKKHLFLRFKILTLLLCVKNAYFWDLWFLNNFQKLKKDLFLRFLIFR